MVVTLMFALVSALSVPAVAAKSDNSPLELTISASVVWNPVSWVGTVSGDITGTIVIMELPASLVGSVEIFNEEVTITTTDGVVIKAVDSGVYHYLTTYKFVANGVITEVSSPDMQWLVGYSLHEGGQTSTFIPGGDVHATWTMRLMAP